MPTRAIVTGNDWLHAPAVAPVWQLFTDIPYPESSIMGGYTFEPRENGTFIRQHAPYAAPMGLSALDFYVMGLIGTDEVPETFLLTDPKPLGDAVFTGEKTPIRVAEIIKASGVRNPPAASSQREFTLGMYLLHDGPQQRADKLAQARGIEKALVEYFDIATQGRMKLVIQRAPSFPSKQ